MLLTIQDLVRLLRDEVNIQSEGAGVIDPAYLQMKDEDIELYIKLGITRAFPKTLSISELQEGSEYPVLLLSKIELYTKLAVLNANKVDMGADNNNYLKQDQRFKHYMSLVAEARAQYTSWLENEGQGEVSSHNVLLSSRHNTKRNYERQAKPSVSIIVDSVTNNCVEFHWNVSNISQFARYKVYVGTSKIVDMYKEGALCSDKITEGSILVLSTNNIRNNYHRIDNLNFETTYFLAVVSVECNQVFGFSEVSFSTLPQLLNESEVNVGSL